MITVTVDLNLVVSIEIKCLPTSWCEFKIGIHFLHNYRGRNISLKTEMEYFSR
jgi:hypothetical protein